MQASLTDPGLKEGLLTAAGLEHRSITNRVEALIRNDCAQRGIAIPLLIEADNDNRVRL